MWPPTVFQLTDRVFEVTSVSDKGRILESLDGRATADVYAETLGVPREQLTRQHLAHHPLGSGFRGGAHASTPVQQLFDGRVDDLGVALTQLPISGFNSFGEQHNGIHTNHSLSGLLLG